MKSGIVLIDSTGNSLAQQNLLTGRCLKCSVAGLLIAAVIAPMPALADDLQAAREVVSVLQKAAANGRMQRVVAELSAPLSYENRINTLDPTNRRDPRNLDVSGVRLGMSSAQVAVVLRAVGFAQDVEPSKQYSYETQVRQTWRLNTGVDTGPSFQVEKRSRWVKSGQKITVEYIALPEGARVDFVAYEADAQVVSQEAFEVQALRKYGEQLNGEADDQRWCTVKAPECEDPRFAHFPVLEASPTRRVIWMTGRDIERKQALDERFKADVAKRGPKQVEPNF